MNINLEERRMTIQAQQDARRSALAQISEQTEIARAALAKAEEIAKEAGVGFDFDIGDGYGSFYTGENRDGTKYGYWDGWQGSSC